MKEILSKTTEMFIKFKLSIYTNITKRKDFYVFNYWTDLKNSCIDGKLHSYCATTTLYGRADEDARVNPKYDRL